MLSKSVSWSVSQSVSRFSRESFSQPKFTIVFDIRDSLICISAQVQGETCAQLPNTETGAIRTDRSRLNCTKSESGTKTAKSERKQHEKTEGSQHARELNFRVPVSEPSAAEHDKRRNTAPKPATEIQAETRYS